ncbi:uncharacterized protein LOC101735603 [Bombyx mori]|uniref:uncharacterized protein LOC101735603 n=1 Tax=Bombyx mori TaxID=7091 RepID=UPI002ED284C3
MWTAAVRTVNKANPAAFLFRISLADCNTHGKIAKSIAILQSKLQKSTKSGSEDEAKCAKCKKIIDLVFGPNKPIVHEDSKDAHVFNKASDKCKDVALSRLSADENSCVKCEKIIDEIFGKDAKWDDKYMLGNATRLPNEDLTILPKDNNIGIRLDNTDAKNVGEKLKEAAICLAINDKSRQKSSLGDGKDVSNQKIEVLKESKLFPLATTEQKHSDDKRELLRDNTKVDFSKKGQQGPETDVQTTLDEIAEKCLNNPVNEIDRRLIHEMKQLGVPQASNRRALGNGLAEIDELKKPKKTVEKTEIDLESREFEKEVEKLHPPFSMIREEPTYRFQMDDQDFAYNEIGPNHNVSKSGDIDTQKVGKPSDVDSKQSFFSSNRVEGIDEEPAIGRADEDRNDEVKMIKARLFPSFEAREEVNGPEIETEEDVTHSFEPNLNYDQLNIRVAEGLCKEEQTVPDEHQTEGNASLHDEENLDKQILLDKVSDKIRNDSIDITNPMNANISAALGPLPKLKPDGEVSLSELMKRVRERNRMEYCREFGLQNLRMSTIAAETVKGECGKKTPVCPPPAPKCPPPCPPPLPPCPPPPPPCPKPCKPVCPPPCPPKKKNPCDKFKKCQSFFIKDALKLNPNADTPTIYCPLFLYAMVVSTDITKSSRNGYRRGAGLHLSPKYNPDLNMSLNEDAGHPVSPDRLLARNFDPWVPIPSWTELKREKKQPVVCPKDGCKQTPPPKLTDPCPKGNPCLNFPIRPNFSIASLFYHVLFGSILTHHSWLTTE